MATTSKFVQLSNSVLLEYVYADQSAINTPGNQFRISTSTSPLWLMANGHNSQDIVLNSDSSELIHIASPNGTGNVRNRAYAKIDTNKYALLDIDKIVYYNDYDSELTPTASLPISFTTSQSPVYDTIKIHLVQGFNFETYQGFIFNVSATKKDNTNLNLLNLIFNKTDSFQTFNPSPFIFGGKVFNSYVEVRVLSLYNLIYDYWLGTLTGNTVVEKVTRDVGIKREQTIQISFGWVNKREKVDDQDYIYLFDIVDVDLPTQDQFESIAATIQESTDGDYIEFYATYKGAIIKQFIDDLNSSGYDYILLHDLVISEYIWDSTSGSYYWTVTDELQLSQTSNYDLPNTYRPVIKNPSAIAYKIDYTIRLFNRNDASQIWKVSSMTSYNAAKYGRKLMSINLGTNPTLSTIYNKNVVKDIQVNRITEPVLNNSKYITSFIDNTQISISYDTINPDVNVGNTVGTAANANTPALSSGNSQIFSNGLARILISDSVSYLKFVIYQKNANSSSNTALNLSGIGSLILSFTSDTSENLDILEYPNSYVTKTKGECVFRLSESQAKKILGFTNRQFRLFLVNEKGERTFLYNGKFYNQSEWLTLSETNRIASLESDVTTLTSSNTDLQSQIDSLNSTVSDMNSQISQLTTQLATETSLVTTDTAMITSLQNQLKSQQTTINNLNSVIASLNAKLGIKSNENMSANGLNINPNLSIAQSTKASITFSEDQANSMQANIKNDTASNFGV